ENADEARTRADRLYEAKLFKEATEAYGELVARFPRVLDAQTNLRRGIAANNARLFAASLSALIAVPASSGETKAEALYYTALVHA
ncbi:hypothetical protein ABTN80_20920, partial [Acinetobacter baumannii]